MTSRADPALAWAASGAMALTGAAGGPPLLPAGAPCTVLERALAALPPEAREPGARLLGERAAAAGHARNAPWSAGGSFRMLAAGDGWVGVSLARPSDVELLPALVQGDVGDPWSTLERWVATQPALAAAERAILLGLPAGMVGEPGPPRPGVVVRPGGPRGRSTGPPLVVDLTALWAGPLCARLLGECGARVVKVESPQRPDGARAGPPTFFDAMHRGHESVLLDLRAERATLDRLLSAADVVLEASRPRALAQLGIDAHRHVAAGTIWVAITAYGQDQPLRVGFGDDVAAAAGLVAYWAGAPVPAGDAIADPLAGAAAAAAAWQALRGERGCHIDVSMAAVCAEAAGLPGVAAQVLHDGAGWIVRTGGGAGPVRPPEPPSPGLAARPTGADTARVLAEFDERRTGGAPS